MLVGTNISSLYFWLYGENVWIPTIFNFLIEVLNTAFFPLSVTLIDVVLKSYPTPLFNIITSIIFKYVCDSSFLSITALKDAPTPSPITVKSGVEWYSSPPSWILTAIIFPFDIIGLNDGLIFLPVLVTPFLTIIFGLFS